MAMRSTALKLVGRTCLRALDYSEAGAPYDRGVFQAGIAAHAVCQVAGEAARAGAGIDLRVLADRVVRELITVGRGFDGVMEPPMPVQAAVAGRDLAIPWLEMYPPSPGARYELGLAVDRDWNPVAYNDPRAYYRAALDVFERIDDMDEDGYPNVTIVVDDFKSAPPTDATELDTVQIRGQAAVALAHHPDARVVRRAVTNLWRRKKYTADLVLDDDGRAVVDQWRRDIDHAIAATEVRGADGRRPANPGAGCMGCPWVTRCDAAREVFAGTIVAGRDGGVEDRGRLAQRWAVARGVSDALNALIRVAAKDAPVPLPDGRVVGYEPTTEKAVKPSAVAEIARRWLKREAPDDVLALLGALRIGVGNVNGALVQLVPSKGDKEYRQKREELADILLDTVHATEFGVFTPAPVDAPVDPG